MQFRFGQRVFRVQLEDGYPVVEGRPCEGCIDFPAGVIRLSAELAAEDRAHTLYHELRHYWTRHHGRPTDDEHDCDSAAAFALEVGRQFAEQGGVEALAAMRSPAQVEAERQAAARPLPVSEDAGPEGLGLVYEPFDDESRPEFVERRARSIGVDCAGPGCERRFFGGDIWTDPAGPRWLNAINGQPVNGEVIERQVWCPDCCHVQRWLEGWDPGRGVPNGAAVDWPEFEHGAEARARHDAKLSAVRTSSAALA